MRRFHFRLESVLEWRRVHLELEETKLQRLFEGLHRIDLNSARLDSEKAEADRLVLHSPSVEAHDLAALKAHRRHLVLEKRRLARERAECEEAIAAQRERVVECERDVRLVERLRERRLKEWETQASREQEALASELYLAHWHRQ
jgi:hypothetical protein